jgi:SAM-dependent methyltransferase
LEKGYYAQEWPKEAKPYLHLEPYLQCWLTPGPLFEGKRVLDIGAGESTYTRLIAEKWRPKQIVACELFERRMFPAAQVNRAANLKFIAGDAFFLPFQEDSFDVVWGSGILSQLPDLDCVLRAICGVLKQNGIYVGWEPNPFNLVIAWRYFSKPHSPNQYLFWPWRIRPAFERAGFELTTRYFYARLPRSRNRLVGSCMGLIAARREAPDGSQSPSARPWRW